MRKFEPAGPVPPPAVERTKLRLGRFPSHVQRACYQAGRGCRLPYFPVLVSQIRANLQAVFRIAAHGLRKVSGDTSFFGVPAHQGAKSFSRASDIEILRVNRVVKNSLERRSQRLKLVDAHAIAL